MPTYAIGDLQGCYDELMDLLEQVRFDPGRDRLWFTGDLVNRGPQSLACLRFVKDLGDTAVTVLGNHELHLLAIGNGQPQYLHAGDTLDEILGSGRLYATAGLVTTAAPDSSRRANRFHLAARGLPPQWQLGQALDFAGEVEQVLRGPRYKDYFANMYGNEPVSWSPDLDGWERLRFITNCLTRIRYCSAGGALDLAEKGVPGAASALPWFEVAGRKSRTDKILFGHWAALRDYHQDYGRTTSIP